MKKILLIILLLSPFVVSAQEFAPLPQLPKDSVTKQVTYKQIVEVPGVSASDIYNRSREWFATTFKSANSVLQMQDKEAGKLIGKGVFTHSYLLKGGFGVSVPMNYVIGFTINITIKEGKYRVIMSDYTVTSQAGANSGSPGTLEAIYDNADIFKKPNNKTQKKIYDIFSQLLKDVDTDSQATMASLKNAASTKAKDDF